MEEKSRKGDMSWKKNVFSYLLWAVYTIMTGTAMVGIGNVLCGDMHLPSCCGVLAAAILTAASGGAAFLLHRFAPRLKAFAQKRRKLCLAAEAGILAVLSTVGAAFRAVGFHAVEETSVYYEMAEVTMGRDIPPTAHGAVHVYVQLLHLVFLFLGNHFVLGITVQMIFQGIAALLLYFTVRGRVGAAAALVVAVFFTCAPYMVRGGLSLSPDMMYLCFLAAAGAVVMACCGNGYRYADRAAGGKLAACLYFAFAGIVSAVAAYLDVAGVLLLLFSIGMIFCVDSKMRGHGPKAVSCLCCALGFALGFAGCALADSLACGKSFGGVLQAWFRLYRPEHFLLPATVGMPDSRVEGLVLLGLMALGIYSFWFEKKRERLTVYMLASCAVILAGCFGIFTAEMPGILFLYLLWVLMAGIGLQQCFGGVEADSRLLQCPGGVEVDSCRKQCLNGGEVPGAQAERDGQEMRKQPENKPEAPADKEPEVKKEIRYIENPLPLPKKHEKRVLDYDHPVADDDDFDI